MPLLSYHCEAEKCNIIIEKLARQGKKHSKISVSLNDSGGQPLDGNVGIVDIYCDLLLSRCFHGVLNWILNSSLTVKHNL